MEFPFCNAVVSVHAHATEDEQRVLSILSSLLPADAEVRKDSTRGHHGNTITVFEARLCQKKLVRELWQRMLAGMGKDGFARLSAGFPERIDDSCFLYLRFDKQAAYRGDLTLTDAGDSVHLRFKVLSFPAERRVAVDKVRGFLGAGAAHEA